MARTVQSHSRVIYVLAQGHSSAFLVLRATFVPGRVTKKERCNRSTAARFCRVDHHVARGRGAQL